MAEVRVLVSNYPAEYGARNGGLINVSIKSWTNQFHGSAYYYYRHEELNANEFFNNSTGLQKARYRYGNPGVTFGGPRYPFARSSFVLPGPTSLGIGSTPPTLTYGPGFENWDLSLYKEFRLGSETRVLQF